MTDTGAHTGFEVAQYSYIDGGTGARKEKLMPMTWLFLPKVSGRKSLENSTPRI